MISRSDRSRDGRQDRVAIDGCPAARLRGCIERARRPSTPVSRFLLAGGDDMKRYTLILAATAVALLAACSSNKTTTSRSSGVAAASVPSSTVARAAASAAASTTVARSVPAGGLSGTWHGNYRGAYTGTFALSWTQSSAKLSGTITLSTEPGALPLNGTVVGGHIQFGTVGSQAITYTGTVSGGAMHGEYEIAGGAGGSGPWSADRG